MNQCSFKALERQALSEADEYFEKTQRSKTELKAVIKEDKKGLPSKRVILLSQPKSFEGDLNDVDKSKTRLEDVYIREPRNSLELASNGEAPRLERKNFSQIVHKYLGTSLTEPSETANSTLKQRMACLQRLAPLISILEIYRRRQKAYNKRDGFPLELGKVLWVSKYFFSPSDTPFVSYTRINPWRSGDLSSLYWRYNRVLNFMEVRVMHKGLVALLLLMDWLFG